MVKVTFPVAWYKNEEQGYLLLTMLCTWQSQPENSSWDPVCTGFALLTMYKKSLLMQIIMQVIFDFDTTGEHTTSRYIETLWIT